MIVKLKIQMCAFFHLIWEMNDVMFLYSLDDEGLWVENDWRSLINRNFVILFCSPAAICIYERRIAS